MVALEHLTVSAVSVAFFGQQTRIERIWKVSVLTFSDANFERFSSTKLGNFFLGLPLYCPWFLAAIPYRELAEDCSLDTQVLGEAELAQ